jgi:hypothetical protein
MARRGRKPHEPLIFTSMLALYEAMRENPNKKAFRVHVPPQAKELLFYVLDRTPQEAAAKVGVKLFQVDPVGLSPEEATALLAEYAMRVNGSQAPTAPHAQAQPKKSRKAT